MLAAYRDLDPARHTLRVRTETTKIRRERVVPCSASAGVLLGKYLRHRAEVSRARGPLLLSKSVVGGQSAPPGSYSQPFSRATRMASMRLCPPTLLMALER